LLALVSSGCGEADEDPRETPSPEPPVSSGHADVRASIGDLDFELWDARLEWGSAYRVLCLSNLSIRDRCRGPLQAEEVRLVGHVVSAPDGREVWAMPMIQLSYAGRRRAESKMAMEASLEVSSLDRENRRLEASFEIAFRDGRARGDVTIGRER
jgi:hypothetical protein